MRFAENSRSAAPQKRAKFTSGFRAVRGQSAQNSTRRSRVDRGRVVILFRSLRADGVGSRFRQGKAKGERISETTPDPDRRGFAVNGITSSGCAGIVALGRSCYIDGLPNRAFDRLPVLAAGLEGRPFFGGRVSFQSAICCPRHSFGGTASGGHLFRRRRSRFEQFRTRLQRDTWLIGICCATYTTLKI
jgi:hypothetical protein